MKPILLMICLGMSVMIFAGCKKNSSDPSASLTGGWEMRTSVGGLLPGKIYPAGNGNIWEFKKDSFRTYWNGKLIDSGKYQITKDAVSPFGTKLNRIMTSPSDKIGGLFYQFSNDTLSLYMGYFLSDGATSTYVRTTTSVGTN
jgi:hypothetical protein